MPSLYCVRRVDHDYLSAGRRTLAAVQNDAAAVLALLGLCGYVGGAIGNAISGAIWTHTLPAALQRILLEGVVGHWEAIYENLDLQLS